MSEDTLVKVAKRIKEARIKLGLTQKEVAAKTKINDSYYAKIERAELRPSIDVYEKIAKTLKVTASDIFPF